jgi:hypothetical protein
MTQETVWLIYYINAKLNLVAYRSFLRTVNDVLYCLHRHGRSFLGAFIRLTSRGEIYIHTRNLLPVEYTTQAMEALKFHIPHL